MSTYSVSVALFDFVPVLVSGAGLVLLARGIARRRPRYAALAWAAALLVPLGGLCKASWKLILALDGTRIDWLENLLFILLAPGFIGLAYALFHARRPVAPADASGPSWARVALWLSLPLVAALATAVLAPGTRGWFFVLLAATVLANFALIAQALIAARQWRLGWPVIAAFIYNLIASLMLGGLARLPEAEASAWLQEGVNLSAQLALAYGGWRLGHHMQETHR